MITTFGLIVIVLGWLYQALAIFKGDKKIQPVFVGLYAFGVLLLILGAEGNNILNFISPDGLSLVLALIVLFFALKKK